MSYVGAIAVVVLLIVVLAAVLCGPLRLGREKAAGGARARAGREHYGPPPGAFRAVGLDELDSRGWPEFPYEYSGNTAASVSHMVMRSA
jgi:hypothetical protein